MVLRQTETDILTDHPSMCYNGIDGNDEQHGLNYEEDVNMNQQSINNEQVMQRWIDYAHSTGYEGVSAIDVVAWAICELKAMREIEGEIKAGNGIDQEMIDVILGLMSEHDIRWDSIDIEFE